LHGTTDFYTTITTSLAIAAAPCDAVY